MDEAMHLRRGAILFIFVAFFVLALTAVRLGAGNLIPGLSGNAFSLVIFAGLLGSAATFAKKW